LGASKEMKNANKYLWPMLRNLPYFRALLRAVEAGFYKDYELLSPVLDLGSGDGHFASVTFERALDVGTDPAWVSLQASKKLKSHRLLTQALGEHMPFESAYFSSAISNSVLEHIPELQVVLNETGRLLKRGAPFLFCVPNDKWTENLTIAKWLNKLGLRRLADAYTRLFIRISRHVNMLSPEAWGERLEQAEFVVDEYWHYFPPKALRALELGHYFGLPSLVSHWLLGRWLVLPSRWNLALTERAIRKYAKSERNSEGTYSFYVARKK